MSVETRDTLLYGQLHTPEQVLLSEGVCCQLGILIYHPDVQPGNGDKKQLKSKSDEVRECKVPMVRVQLIQDVRLLPNECTMVETKLVDEDVHKLNQPLLFELD